MFARRVTPLEVRKQVILLESALHRGEIAQAWSEIGGRLGAVRQRIRAGRWWLAGTALVLGLAVRRRKQPFRWLAAALAAIRAARFLSRL